MITGSANSFSKEGLAQTQAGPAPAADHTAIFISLSPFLLPALLIALTIAAYGQVFSAGFIEAFDDEAFVTRNTVVLQGLTRYGVEWSLSTFMTGNWHPLTWWSHMADVSLFGLNPAGHHSTSLFLHCLNALLLYYFLLRTTGSCGKSFLVAALFALHPLHVESVAWIAERKDLLCTAFGLSALHLYVSYVHTRQRGFYLAMFALFCLSLMSKPMLVTFPFLLLLLDYWPLRRFREQSWRSLMREKIPLLVPALILSLVTVAAQQSVGATVDRALLSRICAVFDGYLVYLKKLFIPVDLASFYPYSPVSPARALLAALLLSAISLCVWQYRHRFPWLVTGWLWFLGLLVPVIGFISVGTQAYADRYTYLPAVGVCIMVVWSVDELFPEAVFPSWARKLLATVLIGACMLLTWKQVGFWQDGFSLYGRELAVVKGNWHAHFNLGSMLVDRQRYDEGIAHYQEALLNQPPATADIYHNLGVAYERTGDTARALNHFRTTVQMASDRDKGYLGIARVLGAAGDVAGALSSIREGQRLVADNGLLLAKEAYLLHGAGDTAAAVSRYRQAIAKVPDIVQNYVNLGILLLQQGNSADFVALVKQLWLVNPGAANDLAKLSR